MHYAGSQGPGLEIRVKMGRLIGLHGGPFYRRALRVTGKEPGVGLIWKPSIEIKCILVWKMPGSFHLTPQGSSDVYCLEFVP